MLCACFEIDQEMDAILLIIQGEYKFMQEELHFIGKVLVNVFKYCLCFVFVNHHHVLWLMPGD